VLRGPGAGAGLDRAGSANGGLGSTATGSCASGQYVGAPQSKAMTTTDPVAAINRRRHLVLIIDFPPNGGWKTFGGASCRLNAARKYASNRSGDMRSCAPSSLPAGPLTTATSPPAVSIAARQALTLRSRYATRQRRSGIGSAPQSPSYHVDLNDRIVDTRAIR
jgi:hypothetical protein